jgi:hypothetical protein
MGAGKRRCCSGGDGRGDVVNDVTSAGDDMTASYWDILPVVCSSIARECSARCLPWREPCSLAAALLFIPHVIY